MRRAAALALLAAALAGCAPKGTPFERASEALREGDLRTARVELLNAVQQAPSSATALLLLARTELRLGDGAAAESALLRARRAGAPEPELRHLVAHARLLEGDASGALALLASVPPRHAAYADRVRGGAHLALGDLEAARADYDRALASSPDDPLLWTDIGRFRRAAGDLAGAIAAADKAVAADPRNADALVLRGELTRGQYGLGASLAWFDRALEADGAHVPALLERAVTYGELGRMSDMLADARLVHQLTGGHPRAWFMQAVLAARARRFELARSLYNRTGNAFADQPAAILLESAIDFETGNVEQAARRLAGLVDRQPGNRKARRLLAAAQWRMNDPRAVTETLAPIVGRPDADSYSLALAGRAWLRLGDSQSASALLARAARPQPEALSALDPLSEADFLALRREAEADPGNGPTEVRLVSALLARGQVAEARRRAFALQARNPGAPEAHLLVGDTLGVSGDFAGAAEQYRKAANLSFTEPVALRLIEALQRSGQSEAAAQVLGLFARQNPRNVPARILLAGQAMQAGDWPQAIALYEDLRRRLGDNEATILNNLAWAYSESGDYRSALPLARRAWALDRNNPATADTLGWILFKSGADRNAGLALLEQAARGAPSDVDIRRRLQQARAG